MENPPRILIVDDDEDDRMITLMALRRTFATPNVKVARDADEALAVLGEEDWEPDLILLDLKMPRGGGLRVLTQLHNQAAQALPRVFVFSSSCAPPEVETCRKLGAAGFVQKPVDFDAYQALLVQVLNAAQDRGNGWLQMCS